MVYAVISLAVMGAVFGVILAVAGKKFAVEVDPRIEAIQKILPGANCGSCGYPGCSGYAEAIVLGGAGMSLCPVCGSDVAQNIAQIMGASVDEKTSQRNVAQLMCAGSTGKAKPLYKYEGIQDCKAVALQYKGPKVCNYGCFGLGTCVASCPFCAITMGEDGLPVIDREACTGCGVCVRECPQQVLQLAPVGQLVHVRCSNKDKGKDAKAACEVACIKCKICEKNCPEGAIKVVGDLGSSIAVIDYEKCTNCGICVEKCPTKVIEKQEPVDKEGCRNTDEIAAEASTGCALCGACKE